ncbi:K(+) efflux antiporter 3 [Picochlorum sp. SENEW3]|nr:K(+) efflux antiporter 3 [Picochlorum sp. SENEW3]
MFGTGCGVSLRMSSHGRACHGCSTSHVGQRLFSCSVVGEASRQTRRCSTAAVGGVTHAFVTTRHSRLARHHRRNGRGYDVKQATWVPHASPDALVALGSDFLLFLGATVLVVPIFKSANQSPVLGYLFAGVVMGQLGLFRDVSEIEKLSELGVLFLLFEMGLELSIDKLKRLAKYAFGLGSLQMLLTTAAFLAVSLPPGHGVMSTLLEKVMHAPPSLAELKTVDEAVVIAVALSLSSSAFVLQLLKEKNELGSNSGQATLGILLFQDIATIPFLVLLPLIEGQGGADISDIASNGQLISQLAPTILKTFGGIGLVLLGGRTFLRRVFEVAAASKSDEVFISLSLLSVTGASLLTQKLGFSDTLGAFVSGVLLSETNFKAQVEADIQPFRGLLLGLFFVTTGASLDLALLIREWPTVLSLFAGLIALKATLITAVGPSVGLSRSDSVKTGFILSQGGEFAFVLLALASQLKVLPEELNKLLIIVVVLSMAVTPLLSEAGSFVAKFVESQADDVSKGTEGFNIEDPVLVCGFGDVGQAVANIFELLDTSYVAFDLTVPRVIAAQEAGFNVLYGDATRPKVLHAAGIETPKSIAVCYAARQRSVSAVASLRSAFPDVPIMARAIDLKHASELEAAGADEVILSEAEAGLSLGARLSLGLGWDPNLILPVTQAMRGDMEQRSHELAGLLAGEASESHKSSTKREGPSSMQGIYTFKDRAGYFERNSGDDDEAGGIFANISGVLKNAIGSNDEDGSDDNQNAEKELAVQSRDDQMTTGE